MDDRHHSDHPKISSITATHDAARTLRACLESVAAQTYADKEHIVIDGLSTDGTVKILEEYATRYPHIRWVSEQDGGIYDALNKGIRMASGEWTYFLGSDDTLSDDTILERIVAHIGEKDIDVFQGDVIVDRQGTEEVCSGKRETFEQLIVDGNLCHQSMFVKRSIFDRFGHFDTKYNARADYAFNLRLFADADVTRMYAPIAIARYDVHGFSSTHIDCAFAEDRKQMLERLVSPEHADAYERIMAAKDALKRKKLKHADADQRNKTVVYTAIFGGKDILQGPPPSEERESVQDQSAPVLAGIRIRDLDRRIRPDQGCALLCSAGDDSERSRHGAVSPSDTKLHLSGIRGMRESEERQRTKDAKAGR